MWEANQHNSPHYSQRSSLYNVDGIPHAEFQGEYPVVGGGTNMYPSYLGRYNLYVNQESPAEIELSISVNDGGERILEADVTMTGDITTTDNKIIFILTHYWSDSYFSTVGFYDQQDFNLTTAGETGHFENVVTLDDDWDISDVKAVAIIQSLSEESSRIHQAAIGDFELIMDPLEPDYVDFGDVPVGTSVTEQITIHNYWEETMTGMIFPIPSFEIESMFTVAPYSDLTLDITFTPTEAIVYDNYIIMMADNNEVFDTQLFPVYGTGTIGSDSDDNELTPEVDAIIGNYPNPFNPTTFIEYNLTEGAEESLIIFNIKGQEVRRFNGLETGKNTIIWDGKDNDGKNVPSGIYFSQLASQGKQSSHKMILVK